MAKSKPLISLLYSIHENQRKTLLACLAKLQNGEKISQTDIAGLAYMGTSQEVCEILDTDAKELHSLAKAHKFPIKVGRSERGQSYYDLKKVMAALWKLKGQTTMDLETAKIEEQVKKLRRENAFEDGFLIQKESAEDRTVKAFTAVRNMIMRAIKTGALMGFGAGSVEELEKKLTEAYEDAFLALKENSEIAEW